MARKVAITAATEISRTPIHASRQFLILVQLCVSVTPDLFPTARRNATRIQVRREYIFTCRQGYSEGGVRGRSAAAAKGKNRRSERSGEREGDSYSGAQLAAELAPQCPGQTKKP
jgi:hypothetical protein